MKNNGKTRYIYHNYDGSHEPATEEEYQAFYKYASNYRRTQQRNCLCVCPKERWMFCDTDCDYCPYRKHAETLSLNYSISDDQGNEVSWLDQLPGGAALLDDLVADTEEMQRLLSRIKELMPEALMLIPSSGLWKRPSVFIPRQRCSRRLANTWQRVWVSALRKK